MVKVVVEGHIHSFVGHSQLHISKFYVWDYGYLNVAHLCAASPAQGHLSPLSETVCGRNGSRLFCKKYQSIWAKPTLLFNLHYLGHIMPFLIFQEKKNTVI